MHPVNYEADFVPRRSRLTTFFRLILVIPHLIWLSLWGIAVGIVTFVAWFAILIVGRYPEGMWRFSTSWFVYGGRVNGYYGLLTDSYPPFGSGGSYPVRVTAVRAEQQSRLTVFFRCILVIPAWIGTYLLGIAQNAVSFLAWLLIVITGRMPAPLQGFILFVHRFQTRTFAYLLLLVDPYPSFAEEGETSPDSVAAWNAPQS